MSAVLLPDRRVADERPGALAQTPTPTAVAVGGKTLRGTCQRDGTGGVHLLAAMTHHTGTVVDKTSEIAWFGPLLNRVDLAGWWSPLMSCTPCAADAAAGQPGADG